MRPGQRKAIDWVLRIGVAGEFAGHGLVSAHGNPAWIPFVTYFGFSTPTALQLMFAVGVIDLLLALHVLIRPWRPALGWMTGWALFTASLRVLVGGSFLEIIERGANVAAPLALLLLGRPRAVAGFDATGASKS